MPDRCIVTKGCGALVDGGAGVVAGDDDVAVAAGGAVVVAAFCSVAS